MILTNSLLRIVGLFFSSPFLGANPNEVKRLTGLSYGASYQGLQELFAEGVLSRKKVGRTNVFTLDSSGEAARDALVLVAQERRKAAYGRNRLLAAALRETVRRVKQAVPGIISIVLYGSRARGEEKKGSDVDLLFMLPGRGIKGAGRKVAGICSTKGLEHGQAISAMPVSAEEFSRMLGRREHNLAHEVVLGGIPLHGAEAYIDRIMGCLEWKKKPAF